MSKNYPYDIFISYSHIDNEPLVEGRKGWVTMLNLVLEKMLGQKLGRKPSIWRDQQQINGNAEFRKSLNRTVSEAALFLSIVTPRYIKSRWCQFEWESFIQAAETDIGVSVNDLSRMFKVVKSPCNFEELPPALKDLPGIHFYGEDPETGRFREFNPDFGDQFLSDFLLKVDDLAYDIQETLSSLNESETQKSSTSILSPPQPIVFLADAGGDACSPREGLRRELESMGYQVLPDRPLPLQQDLLQSYLAYCLDQACISIHVLGNQYGYGPYDHPQSMEQIQYEMARKHRMSRLVWLPYDQKRRPPEARQKEFLDGILFEESSFKGPEIFRNTMQELVHFIKSTALSINEKDGMSPVHEMRQNQSINEYLSHRLGKKYMLRGNKIPPQVYLIHAHEDLENIMPYRDFLLDAGCAVLLPAWEGEAYQVRQDHEENLKCCDAVLIYYGLGQDWWFSSIQRDLLRARGMQRNHPFSGIGICLGAPYTPKKALYRSPNQLIMDFTDGFEATLFHSFLSLISGNNISL